MAESQPVVLIDGAKAIQSAVNYVANQAAVPPDEALAALTAAAQGQQREADAQNAAVGAINALTMSFFAVPVVPDFEAKPSSGDAFVAGVIASLK